jgi:hypothetical protein
MKQEVTVKTESNSMASATVQRQETQALELVERSLSQGGIKSGMSSVVDLDPGLIKWPILNYLV